MIDRRESERYRNMSIEDKLREFNRLMDGAFEALGGLPPEKRRRRWEEEEEQSALALARKLARLPR